MASEGSTPQPNPAAGRRVIVSLDDTCLKDPATWKRVVDRLRLAGLHVSKEMTRIGIVAGSIPGARVADLRREDHVFGVEDDERRSAQ